MDIYKFAMQIEKDGENYYREFADNCHVEGIKTILIMLADEEVKHSNTIAQLQKHADNSSPAKMAILDNVKNIDSRA